ncbi:hypothetical protein BDY19DRAFT_889252 [Irpex rosettiformis]|uniref:Uncharacterized protein n=1 Tax=Irpex rosettiformis TaxID=378272 RepID=A0ACB8U5K0_9APHY|nr:hypothetical protein BDY19DRAFT_889252 [Irpex rosettiformis]
MDIHRELHVLRTELRDVFASMAAFNPPVVQPPIIDASADNNDDGPRQDSIRGLRKLKESVKRDLDILEKFLANPNNAQTPALSTNALYLIAVWKEVLHAKHPVVAIWDTYSERGIPLHLRKRNTPKEPGIKVDVVADGGKRWIRVNTTKNSRMLAEFREIDSYLTDSDSDEDIDSDHHIPTLAQTELDNSLVRMGRSLLAAARENPLPGELGTPNVTIRLTRLDPSPINENEHDPRIAQTIQELRGMGVDVQLGERSEAEVEVEGVDRKTHKLPQWQPSTVINVDLSILIAMVSDLTHAPLPLTVEEAESRFTPGSQYIQWKKKRAATTKDSAAQLDDDDQSCDGIDARPSRALVQQAIQEMNHALFQDIFQRTAPSNPDQKPTRAHLEFWTTHEARERCLQIVGKIGGQREKRRAEILLCPNPTDIQAAEREFWRDSRYSTGYISLLPIKLLPRGIPETSLEPPLRSSSGRLLSPFFRSLAKTCRDILAQETISRPRVDNSPVGVSANGEDDLGEIERATVMKANPRLTVHTVQSMLWGAVYGWTTLTANKTSVKALLRDIKTRRNGALWDRGYETDFADHGDEDLPQVAAIWTVDPRSLAEGMRADFMSS